MTQLGQAAAPAQAAPGAQVGHFSGLPPPAYHGQAHEDELAWLFQLDSYKLMKNLHDAQLLVVLGNCLKDEALNWFMSTRPNLPTYEDFKRAAQLRFGESESVLTTKVMNIKQGKHKSVRQYVDRFRRVVQQSNYPMAGRKKLFV